MEGRPRISIVTPSLNQARYIGQTIESVLAQAYPDLEHVVIDGGSTDGTREILARHPHLRVVSEPDEGHAAAVNKGFRLATGQIRAFLNADDLLLPGALDRVAREIDPARGRHVVMGRCRFVDEQGRFIGVEHPCRFEGHRRVLEVWKGHAIPQPAVFWAAEVWAACGGLDEGLTSPWIDYDLFCRMSRRYPFHVVDQVLAAYRLHPESQTGRSSEADRLEESIRISRRHWGSPLRPMRWRLALSLALFRFNRVGRARRWLRLAREGWRRRQVGRALPLALAGAALAPEVAFYVAIYPSARERAKGVLRKALDLVAAARAEPPEAAVYLDRTEAWDDDWAGPRLVVPLTVDREPRAVRLRGWAEVRYMSRPLVLTVSVDGLEIGRQAVTRSGDLALELALPAPLAPGEHRVEVQASAWFVPHRFFRDGDFRPLSWRVAEVRLT
jgi:glycosyltransferase involved in cell wall biosynthesis